MCLLERSCKSNRASGSSLCSPGGCGLASSGWGKLVENAQCDRFIDGSLLYWFPATEPHEHLRMSFSMTHLRATVPLQEALGDQRLSLAVPAVGLRTNGSRWVANRSSLLQSLALIHARKVSATVLCIDFTPMQVFTIVAAERKRRHQRKISRCGKLKKQAEIEMFGDLKSFSQAPHFPTNLESENKVFRRALPILSRGQRRRGKQIASIQISAALFTVVMTNTAVRERLALICQTCSDIKNASAFRTDKSSGVMCLQVSSKIQW